MAIIDLLTKIATIVIAVAGTYLSFYIFNHNKKRSAIDREKDRNIQSFKSLILDHNLKFLYSFFESISGVLEEFKAPNLSDEAKSAISERVSDQFRFVRYKFVDILLAVDENLYNTILSKMDDFQQHLAESAFDNGINLSHAPKYEEIVTFKEVEFKTEIIKTLFLYKG